MNLQLVVTRMCKLGMAEEAIEKITSSFGAGKTRSYLVGVSFMFTQPSQVAEAYARLEYEDEKLSARDGLGYGMGDTLVRARSPFAFDVSTMGFSTQESNEILTKCVERYVMGMYAQSPSDTAGMVEAVFSTPMSDQAKLASLSAVSQFVPFEAWDQLAKVTTGDKTAASEMLMRRMISRDPGKAVDKMVSSPTATKYLAPGFHAWMAADATRPITWLEENKGRISPVQRDAALRGITKFALDHKEYDVASQWANQIENPSDRAAVLKEVEKIANTAKNK